MQAALGQPAKISPPSDSRGDADGDKIVRKKNIGKKIIAHEILEEIAGQEEVHAQILSRRNQGRGNRDAGDEEGQAEERPQRQESDQPQAGDRHRPFQGAQGRQEGAGEEELRQFFFAPAQATAATRNG
ncbi:MAG TPA: hypothetical protein VMD55_07835 [Terracidiphilus sp.]|nr:hypothetical protein [Terracidiphilus sp.]